MTPTSNKLFKSKELEDFLETVIANVGNCFWLRNINWRPIVIILVAHVLSILALTRTFCLTVGYFAFNIINPSSYYRNEANEATAIFCVDGPPFKAIRD